MIRSIRRLSTRVIDRLDVFIGIQGIEAKIMILWVKCRPNVGAINDVMSIISKDLEGHSMTNVFGNTNPMTTFLSGI